MVFQRLLWVNLFFICSLLHAAGWILNDPYPTTESQMNIYYSSYAEQPKTLDPAKSYSANESIFVSQIYEPPLQYDYLKRPYELVPATASQMPSVQYFNEKGQLVLASDEHIVKSVYTIHIKPGILYQPHPAFAKNANGQYIYFPFGGQDLRKDKIKQITDFKHTGTRELTANDYVYQIKRLAAPFVNSPIYGLMSEYIIGFSDYAKILPKPHGEYIDLRDYPLEGVRLIDDYTFEISIKGQYPQFIFWLAMPFFSPIPWEADRFYQQEGMSENNLSFGWFPVGTGAFMLSENNPNSRIVLEKNPNFHDDYFPTTASLHDMERGYLHHPGARLPLIDKAIYTLEKESIPRWSKFLQGYYDLSAIGADSFDQAIQITADGKLTLGPDMQQRGIKLSRTIDPSIYYLGFNMLDPVVGGTSERARKLRQAIAIAVNFDEYITIFFNGRGFAAQSPIPPGIFGHRVGKQGINTAVYYKDGAHIKRRPIEYARALMTAAGYPKGRDPKTHEALILHYDVPATGGPDDKAQLDWMRKQFARIGISLNIRATQYNRFQEKMRTGNAQIYSWGWNADYPDPENFLFLLYGGNGKVKYGGENASNYHNRQFDALFDLMKNRPNDEKRQQLIDQMVRILRHDTPWSFGFNPESFVLSQQWISPIKANTISLNTLKYVAINVPLRNQLREAWNQPKWLPLLIFLLMMVLLFLLFARAYRKKERQAAKRGPIC